MEGGVVAVVVVVIVVVVVDVLPELRKEGKKLKRYYNTIYMKVKKTVIEYKVSRKYL